MKKLSALLASVLVAGCAFAAIAAVAAPPTKVEADVSIKLTTGSSSDPYTEPKFHGKVSAKHGCKKQRKVLIKKQGGGTVAADKSNAKGFYEAGLPNDFDPGNYFASVKKRVIRKGKGENRRKFKCKKGRSETISAP